MARQQRLRKYASSQCLCQIICAVENSGRVYLGVPVSGFHPRLKVVRHRVGQRTQVVLQAGPSKLILSARFSTTGAFRARDGDPISLLRESVTPISRRQG